MRHSGLATMALCGSVILGGLPARTARANVCGQAPDALVLLDRSGSMQELAGGQSKWSVALSATNSVVSTFSGQIYFGLMLFSRWPHVSNCSSGQVNVAPGPGTQGSISATLSATYPSGDTPLSLSLDEARKYLVANNSGRPQYVVLVTDGKETCQPASVNTPQLAAGKLMAAGIKTYVVGFGGGVDPSTLNATAQAGGTGSYYQADNLTQLNNALKAIAAQISCCGDGKLDASEQCDTAVPAGQIGACPTSCNDGNACTQDFLSGSGCGTTCSFIAVTKTVNGDGCCPPGASSATDSDCPASCGNGTLDAGELCDTGIPSGQWGGCPTSCSDGNPCTQDTLIGSGCSAQCKNTGTCPTNTCGNGKVDAGEWCDTTIPAGKPGACPQTCNDGNTCTQDLKTGSGCLVKCSFVPITKAAHGDGCCAAGASAATDSDCPKSCGNGLLDAGEKCDPGIKAGAGLCPKSCDDHKPCTKDFLGGSACAPTCMHTALGPSGKQQDGCCPAGATLAQDADCKPVCEPDSTKACSTSCENVKCADGEYCAAGKCFPWPTDNTDQGADPTTPGPETIGSGCQCRTTADAAPDLAGLALVLLVFALPRRRTRR